MGYDSGDMGMLLVTRGVAYLNQSERSRLWGERLVAAGRRGNDDAGDIIQETILDIRFEVYASPDLLDLSSFKTQCFQFRSLAPTATC
jgi:hypothetical protein